MCFYQRTNEGKLFTKDVFLNSWIFFYFAHTDRRNLRLVKDETFPNATNEKTVNISPAALLTQVFLTLHSLNNQTVRAPTALPHPYCPCKKNILHLSHFWSIAIMLIASIDSIFPCHSLPSLQESRPRFTEERSSHMFFYTHVFVLLFIIFLIDCERKKWTLFGAEKQDGGRGKCPYL